MVYHIFLSKHLLSGKMNPLVSCHSAQPLYFLANNGRFRASQTCELFLVMRFKKACKQVKEILISYPLMCAMEALKVWARMRWWEMNYSRLVRVGVLSSSMPYALLEGADFHFCCIVRVLQALSKHPIIQWVNMIVMRSMMPI